MQYSRNAVHKNVDAMFCDACRLLTKYGREQLGYTAVLEDINYSVVCNGVFDFDLVRAAALFLWLVRGEYDMNAVIQYLPEMKGEADATGFGMHAHGPRIMNPLYMICNKLIEDKNTTAAVIPIFQQSEIQNVTSCRYVSWQFVNRFDRLHMVVNMRACNLWQDLPYDVFVASTFLRILANELRLLPGSLTYNTSLLYLEEKDMQIAADAAPFLVTDYAFAMSIMHGDYQDDFQSTFSNLRNLLWNERCIRGKRRGASEEFVDAPIFMDLLKACQCHFGGLPDGEKFHSQAFDFIHQQNLRAVDTT